MQILDNGWHVPEGDTKMLSHVASNETVFRPTYEWKQRDAITSTHPNMDTFIDVGTNIGVWSIGMKNYFKKVISYEPSPKNLECLRLNYPGDNDIREVAVGNQTGKVSFKDSVQNCGNGRVRPDLEITEEGAAYVVDIVKLDDEGITNCSLIKIDVQGFEWPVVQGAENLIDEQKPWVTVEPNQDIGEMCEFFFKRNYDFILVKSKRTFIFAPRAGINTPAPSAFGIRPSTQLVLDQYNIRRPS
jgi:FkbM family methyltransferase